MLKKIFTIILFLSLSSCGYKAMHSIKNSANYDFFISELTFIGDRVVNIKMKTKLNNYTLVKKDKNFIIRISSSAEKIIIAKDTAGDATSFKSTIEIDAQVTLENDLVRNLKIVENFTYDNIVNQFDLTRYEREIKINLTETATDKLIFKLSNMQ
tara:strand:+ start:1276 stop:1740 length:465 start_codon:yes stop_codon:yes gene_type:complete